MGLSTAERNRRKRERKKRAKQLERKRLEDEVKELEPEALTGAGAEIEVEIEYVAEPLSVSLSKVQSIESSGDGNTDKDTGTGTDTDVAGDGMNDADDDSISAVLRRFHARAGASLVSDDDEKKEDAAKPKPSNDGNDNDDDDNDDDDSSDDDDEYPAAISNRKLRERNRPTVAQLKNRVERADLVEAHDISATDPDFLLFLKSTPSTVPVPRHWGRKRKYLQGKRGIEKAPFQLPDFIIKTGISEVRAKVDEDESGENAKSKNRSRVAPKMGALDVDYRTLHDAFFKHQNKTSIQDKLTGFGDLYYEGKEYESQKSSDLKVGILTPSLRDALNMTDTSPPPWLMNMQRYGPPPSYPNLKLPGLNAPLPAGCSYGYHVNGWGKPPVDNFGRALFGGNPFDAPGSSGAVSTADWDLDASSGAIVTSDGKTILRKPWGALPMAGMGMGLGMGMGGEGDDDDMEEDSSDEESSDDDDSSSEDGMVESDDDDDDDEDKKTTAPQEPTIPGMASVGVDVPESANDLRKQVGTETPLVEGAIPQSKQLYTVLHQTSVDKDQQAGAVFASDVGYVVPGGGGTVPEGMESVLSKAPLTEGTKRKHKDVDDDDDDDDENEDLGKKFKF